MLAKLLTAQAAADASRPAPLKALLRSLENNAALFLQQVCGLTVALAWSLLRFWQPSCWHSQASADRVDSADAGRGHAA